MMKKTIIYLKLFSVLCVASIATIWILNQWVMPFYTRHSEEIQVPNLTGMDFLAASKKLDALELSVRVRRQYNKQSPKNTILYQSPEPGSLIKRGRVIRLIVSDDEQVVTVPELKLATIRDAAFILESSGLKPGKQSLAPSEEFPAGIVVAQSVAAGEKIQTGTIIDLVISNGRTISNVQVPYLTGKSLLVAKSVIADSSLKLGMIHKKYNPDLLPGTVIVQVPDSGMTVAPYTEIELTISSTDPADE
jgi:serine/threonine-protein kinase